jgi:hypothetical protein
MRLFFMGGMGWVRARILPPQQDPVVVGMVRPRATLEGWIGGRRELQIPEGDAGSHGGDEDRPIFDVGNWRFRVRSQDGGLLEELQLLCRMLSASPRPEVDFTVRLIQCTEQGRLPGWGWTRERIPGP